MITKEYYLFFIVFLLNVLSIYGQKNVLLGMEIGTVITSSYEYSIAENFVKSNPGLHENLQINFGYQIKKHIIEFQAKRFIQSLSFKISGAPAFSYKEGFDRVSYSIPLRCLSLYYQYTLFKNKSFQISSGIGFGLTLNLGGHELNSNEDEQVISLIDNQFTTLYFDTRGRTSAYLRIPNTAFRIKIEQKLTKKFYFVFAFATEHDFKPISVYDLRYSYKAPQQPSNTIGSRTLILGTNRYFFNIGCRLDLDLIRFKRK
jgi:hypothetical protein